MRFLSFFISEPERCWNGSALPMQQLLDAQKAFLDAEASIGGCDATSRAAHDSFWGTVLLVQVHGDTCSAAGRVSSCASSPANVFCGTLNLDHP